MVLGEILHNLLISFKREKFKENKAENDMPLRMVSQHNMPPGSDINQVQSPRVCQNLWQMALDNFKTN